MPHYSINSTTFYNPYALFAYAAYNAPHTYPEFDLYNDAFSKVVWMPTSTVTRDRRLNRQIISNVVYDYIDAISNMIAPVDAEQQRRDLVTYIDSFESLRGNCILDHAPELTTFLREYGYKK